MKRNKNIFGLIMIAVFLTVIVSVNPIKKLVKNVSNDLSGSNSSKTITASFTYTDSEGKQVHDGEEIYVFITDQENGQGAGVGIKLKANGKTEKITEIYDQNWSNKNQKLESEKYYVTVVTPKNGTDADSLLNQKYDQNSFDIYNSGDVYNGSYTIEFPKEIEFNGKNSFELKIEIKGMKGDKISLEDMLSPMDTATRFGIFSLNLEISADVEATIATQKANKITQDYGLSERNFKALETKKIIKVDKIYKKNDQPLPDKQVEISIKNGEKEYSKSCKTNAQGKCSVEFEVIENGTYTVSEKINGQVISETKTVLDEDNNKVEVELLNNNVNVEDLDETEKIIYNYNYVESVGTNSSEVKLEKMRKPGTLVLGNEELVTQYKENQEFKNNNENEKVTIVKAGTTGYPKIKFNEEFEKLKNLSIELASAVDSDDIKVYHMKADQIKNSDIDFNSDDKEYILVNVDCSNVTEVIIGGRNKRDGVSLYDDGKNASSKNSNELDDSFVYNNGAKIIYNFYIKENGIVKTYSKNIRTTDSTTGIILAPDAEVDGAVGNHAGTIIAKEYHHTQGEVHQRVKPKWIDTDTPAATITNKLIEEEKKEQDVSIGKVDANNNPIVGAELQLLDKDNNVIESWTSDNNLHKVTQKLTSGEPYTVHEVKAPTGYQKAKDYTFTYDEKTITYYMTDTKVIVSKFDENQSYLPGATLQILDKDDKVIEEWVTDGKQHYVNYQLEVGETYTLHEEKAPEGYKKAEDVKFVYESNDKDQTVEMKDQKIVIGVFVEKKNMNDELLSGAHLQVLDSNGTILDDWISDGTVHRVNTELEIGGKYTLHEEEAPEGYELSPDVSFEVKNTEDNQIVTMVDNKIIIPGEPYVKIRKEDKDGKLLEGAELQLLDSEGNVIEEWTSNDKEHIVDTKLEVGKQYTLHEKTAPRGYEKAEDITFVAQENEQEVKMIDKRIKKVAGVVETLDKITKYVTIFAITLSLLLLGLYTYRKLNKRYTE